jgi:hypothetical protein
MKRKISILVVLVAVLSLSTFADGLVKDIKGKENKGIKVTYNGKLQEMKDGVGNVVYPVIINGTTYLPVRAIASTLGVEITWDGASQTVNISDGGSEVPTDLPPTIPTPDPTPTTPDPTPTTPTTPAPTVNAGTLADPVEFGKTFTWEDENKSKSYGFKSTASVSVTKAVKLTSTELVAMGFKASTDPEIEYYKVSLVIKGKNVTPTTLDTAYLVYSNTQPSIYGSISKSGVKVIGSTAYGFDGSISRAMSDRYAGVSTKINKGSIAAEVNYSGDIILPVVKGEECYLVIRKANSELENNSRNIHFKLK